MTSLQQNASANARDITPGVATLQTTEGRGAQDAVLTHSRLSQNDSKHSVITQRAKDVAMLEKNYHITLNRLHEALQRQAQIQSEINSKACTMLQTRAEQLYSALLVKIRQSGLIGKDINVIPRVDDLVSGRVPWGAWVPEESQPRTSLLPSVAPSANSALDSAVVANKRSVVASVEISDDEELDTFDLDTKPAMIAAPPSANNGSLASRWNKQNVQPTLPTSLPSQVNVAPQMANNAQVIPTVATITPAGLPTIANQPTAAMSQHYSVQTVDQVTKTGYDTSKDQQAKLGPQVKQSAVRILFANLLHRLLSSNGEAVGNPANRTVADAGSIFRICGRV